MAMQDELTRRRFLKTLGGGVVLLGGGALTGCGGGVLGQGDKPPAGGGGGTPGGGTPGGGTPGTPLTSAQRIAAIDAVNAHAKSIYSNNLTAMNQQMLAYLRGRSEFSRVGLSADGVVWGRFTDDSVYYFINNIRPDAAPLTTAIRPRTRATSEMPRTGTAYVMSGVGTYLKSVHGEIRSLLLANGYTQALGSVSEASLEAMRNIRNAGVLYLITHGGEGDNGFGLTTTTVVTPALDSDPVIRQEVKDKILFYASVAFENPLFGEPEFQRVYGVTHRFITKYWTFGDNSLCYIDACSSDDTLLKAAAMGKNAGLYAGWTNPAKAGVICDAALFAFDRMLGANEPDPKEDPPQRPFDYAAMWADMKKRGMDVSSGGEYGTSRLIFSLSGDYGLLAPSIKFMDVDEEKDQLILHGLFGQDRGIVRVGTRDLAIVSWEKERVVATLPRSGPGSYGDVVAIVRNHKSNVRRLTEWRGRFTYTMDAVGTLEAKMLFDIHIRADLQDYRDAPGEAPKKRATVPFLGALDSKCTYRCSGHAENEDATADWSGQGELPYISWNDPVVVTPHMRIRGTFDTVRKRISLAIDARHLTGIVHFGTNAQGSGTAYLPLEPLLGVFDRLAVLPPDTLPRSILDIPMDDDFDIRSSQRSKEYPNSTGIGSEPMLVTMVWQSIPATAPPEADDTRAA